MESHRVRVQRGIEESDDVEPSGRHFAGKILDDDIEFLRTGEQLIVQPHPASMCFPEVYAYPEDIDILGQITGVAMRLDLGKRRRARP